jgi:VCBS repeat-containing protein
LTGWTLISGNTDGSFELANANGQIVVANAESVNHESISTYTLTVTVSDGTQTSAAETVTINVLDVNDRPIAVGEQFVTEQLQGILVSAPGLLVNDFDEDGDSLSAVLVSGPSHGSLTLNPDGSFNYFPNENFFGTDSFTYQTDDGSAESNFATVQIVVTPLAPSGGDTTAPVTPTPTPTQPANPDTAAPEPTEATPVPAVAPVIAGPPKSGTNTPTTDSQSADSIASEPTAAESRSLLGQIFDTEADSNARNRNRLGFANVGSPREIQQVSAVSFWSRHALPETILPLMQFSGNDSAEPTTPDSVQEFLVGTTAITSTTLSVGYVIWLLRGGSLVASLMSTLPAWSEFDPLAVLEEVNLDEDTESLLDIATGDSNPQD